jgi:hypothetical protein
MLAAAGGVVGLWFWIQRLQPVLFVTLPVGEYTDPAWPTNPWAENDSKELGARFARNPSAFNFQERERFVALLKSLEPEESRPVVLHLSALAATRDGKVFLLLGHEKPNEPKAWLPMANLLDLFGKCRSKQKLMILDVVRPIADPFHGPLHDDVAERLHDLLAISKLNYFVLTSCSPGETALPLEPEQLSVFSYYLTQGLGGAADGYNASGERNEHVSVRELAAFVTARVSRWAERCVRTTQTPELFGNSEDFSLTFEQIEREPPGVRSYPAGLVESWKNRDAMRLAGKFRTAPRTATALDLTLLRAERAWDGGSESANYVRFLRESDELQAALKAERSPRPIPMRSLIAAHGDKPISDALVAALEKLLAVKVAMPPKPDEVQAAADAFALKAKDARMEATAAIWRYLVQDPEPSQERLRTLADLLEKTQPARSTESLLLQRISMWQLRSFVWPGTAVHALLLSEDSIGQALTLAPAGFPWIRLALAQAAAAHREGEKMLLGAKTQAEVRAAQARLVEAERDSRSVLRQWRVVQAMRRATEDSAPLLFGIADNVIVSELFAESDWRGAVAAGSALADSISRAPDGAGIPLTQWENQLEAWRHAEALIRTPFADEIVRKQVVAAGARLRPLLNSTLVSAANRKLVWDADVNRVLKLHADVVALDQADDAAKTPTPGPRTSAGNAAESDRAARRTRVSAELWQLTGLGGEASPEDWLVRLPQARAECVARQDWLGASRLDRVAIIGDDRGGRPPAAQQLRSEEQQCRQWLADWYVELGRLRTDVPGASGFCDDAAADLRQPPRD